MLSLLCGAPCTPRIQYGKRGVLFRPVRTPPAHPYAARARGLPRIPRPPRARRYPRTPRLPRASRLSRMPQLHSASTCKPVAEDTEAPTGSPGRLPATEGTKAPSDTLETLETSGGLGALDTEVSLGSIRVLELDRGRGVLGHLWGPWTPLGALESSGSRGTSEASGRHNCKNGFWSVLENHRFLKKSRKSYQIFRNNSKSQTMKSAQELFYRFWDRAIMTQSITAVFANRGGASAQYRTKKVSHN